MTDQNACQLHPNSMQAKSVVAEKSARDESERTCATHRTADIIQEASHSSMHPSRHGEKNPRMKNGESLARRRGGGMPTLDHKLLGGSEGEKSQEKARPRCNSNGPCTVHLFNSLARTCGMHLTTGKPLAEVSWKPLAVP